MNINESVIPHFDLVKIDYKSLQSMVKVEPGHLMEKSTWYIIDGSLYYFKERDRVRIFTELFCRNFAEILGLDAAEYSLAYVSERLPSGRKGPAKCGLISKNYQKPDKNYYLVSDLMDSRISNFASYGGYSLENLLQYLMNDFGNVPGIQNTITSLVYGYVFDYFTSQTDRNPKNVCCEVGATPHRDKNGYYGLHGRTVDSISLAPIFDNEKSLGISKTPHGYDFTDCSSAWNTACPYSLTDDGEGFNTDPNILLLFYNYEQLARPLIERLAYDDEFRKAIEIYRQTNSEILLSQTTVTHLTTMFENRQKALRRVLELN